MANTIQSPIQTEVCLKTWAINDYEVQFFQKGDDFRTETCNVKTSRRWNHTYPNVCLKTSTFRDYVLSCQVLAKDNQRPEFLPKHSWTIDNKIVNLVIGKTNELACEVIDRKLGTKVQLDAYDCLFPSYRCHADTLERIEKIKRKSLHEMILFFKDFRITCIVDQDFDYSSEGFYERQVMLDSLKEKRDRKIDFAERCRIEIKSIGYVLAIRQYASYVMWSMQSLVLRPFSSVDFVDYMQNEYISAIAMNRDLNINFWKQVNEQRKCALKSSKVPFLVEIEPKSEPSQIDNKVRVSQFMWAVTLICYGGSYDTESHASLIVEGLNDGVFDGLSGVNRGDYFSYHAEFAGSNKIRIEMLKSKKLMFDQRTDVWKVPSEQVIIMMNNISEQQHKVKYDPSYNLEIWKLLPDDQHPNCCLWCLYHLREAQIIDLMSMSSNLTGLLRGYVKNYTKYTSHYRAPPLKTNVGFNTRHDEIDCSEATIKYKESL